MDPAATAAAFQALAGKVTWAEKNTVLVFTPSSPLPKGSVVKMTVSSAALSAAGVPLATAKTVSFATVATASPASKTSSTPKSKPKRDGSGGGSGSGSGGG